MYAMSVGYRANWYDELVKFGTVNHTAWSFSTVRCSLSRGADMPQRIGQGSPALQAAWRVVDGSEDGGGH